MPGSVISLFSEPDEFQAALREDGLLNLLITGGGQFRARLTQVRLNHMRLSAGAKVLLSLPLDRSNPRCSVEAAATTVATELTRRP
jgi:hypothetical protein